MHRARKHLRPAAAGFTLIEVLAVVAVIAILISIALLGYQAIENNARKNRTRMMLSNAASIFAEYESQTALKVQPPAHSVTPRPAGYNFYYDADSTTIAIDDPVTAPPVSVELPPDFAKKDTNQPPQGYRETAILMRELERIPSVRNMLSQLPADAFVTVVLDHPTGSGPSVKSRLMLDGWGNPILFVPRGGLADVRIGDGTNKYIIRSTKAVIDTATPSARPPVPPDARPFFASAGPDGSFTFIDVNRNNSFQPADDTVAGDDNVYSFEN